MRLNKINTIFALLLISLSSCAQQSFWYGEPTADYYNEQSCGDPSTGKVDVEFFVGDFDFGGKGVKKVGIICNKLDTEVTASMIDGPTYNYPQWSWELPEGEGNSYFSDSIFSYFIIYGGRSVVPGYDFSYAAYIITQDDEVYVLPTIYDEAIDACDIDAPTVETYSTSVFDSTTATFSGGVTNNGGASITAKGVYWSTDSNPSLSDNSVNYNAGNDALFYCDVTGLPSGTLIYYRMWARNAGGTGVGDVLSITTDSPTYDITVTTDEITDIDSDNLTAIAGGEATGTGTITETGVCWTETKSIPDIGDNKVSMGSSFGNFSDTLTDLLTGVQIQARAYAIDDNSNVYYGSVESFEVPVYPDYAGNGGLDVTTDFDSIIIDYPSSVSSGDFLIMLVGRGYLSETDSYTTPSGWTKVTNTESSDDLSVAMFVRTAGSSEASTVTVHAGGIEASSPLSGIIYKYEDVSSYKNASNYGVSSKSTESSTPTVPSDERMCIFHVIADDYNVTLSGGFTTHSNNSTSSNLGMRYIARSAIDGEFSYGWTSGTTALYSVTMTITLE